MPHLSILFSIFNKRIRIPLACVIWCPPIPNLSILFRNESGYHKHVLLVAHWCPSYFWKVRALNFLVLCDLIPINAQPVSISQKVIRIPLACVIWCPPMPKILLKSKSSKFPCLVWFDAHQCPTYLFYSERNQDIISMCD